VSEQVGDKGRCGADGAPDGVAHPDDALGDATTGQRHFGFHRCHPAGSGLAVIAAASRPRTLAPTGSKDLVEVNVWRAR
jgi:hypothetical protein